MEFYTQDILKKINKDYKKSILIMIASLIVVIAITTVGFVVMSYDTKLLWEILICVFDIIGLFIFVFIISTSFTNSYRYRVHIKTVMSASPVGVKVKVESIADKPITLSSGLRCYQVNVITDQWKKQYYLLDIFQIESIEIGKSYTFYIASSYIKEIGHE